MGLGHEDKGKKQLLILLLIFRRTKRVWRTQLFRQILQTTRIYHATVTYFY